MTHHLRREPSAYDVHVARGASAGRNANGIGEPGHGWGHNRPEGGKWRPMGSSAAESRQLCFRPPGSSRHHVGHRLTNAIQQVGKSMGIRQGTLCVSGYVICTLFMGNMKH